MHARLAELEDWENIRDCFRHLKHTRHSMRLGGEEPILRAYFINSLVDLRLALPILVDECGSGKVHGFALLQESVMPCPTEDGTAMEMNLHSFIRAVYVRAGTAPAKAQLLEDLMTSWALSRKHKFLCGNCRPDFPARFAKRYGYEIEHVIVKKRLGGTNLP